jgi:hypothetical protein
MTFITEPTGYEKTAISDLQGSWHNLRDAVVENLGSLIQTNYYFISMKR